MFQVILAVIIFLLGFYCGKVWVTKLAGKTISFSLRGALAVIFLVLVIIALIIASINMFRPNKAGISDANTYQSDTTSRN